MEAVGKRHIIVYAWIREKTERPSHSEGSEKIEVSGEQKSAFSFHTTQPVLHGCSTEIEVPSQQNAFSCHTVQTDLACEKGLAFHTENSAPPPVCILALDAQEIWALARQLKLSADMLAHIPIVVSGMKFSQQVQYSSLQILNNPSALRSL